MYDFWTCNFDKVLSILDVGMPTEEFSAGSGIYFFHSIIKFLKDATSSVSPENNRCRGSFQSSAEYQSPRYATSTSSISDNDIDIVRNHQRISHAPLSYSADGTAWFPVELMVSDFNIENIESWLTLKINVAVPLLGWFITTGSGAFKHDSVCYDQFIVTANLKLKLWQTLFFNSLFDSQW